MSRPRRQRGTALIAAIFVAALAVAAGAAMVESQDFALRRLETTRDYEQAQWVLKGGTQWARSILAEDARGGTIDHPGEIWAMGLPPTKIEQGTVAGTIVDQQGLFNLRNLVHEGKPSPGHVAALRRLLAILGLREALADSIVALPLVELGDLYRAPGIDEAAFQRLRPFVTVLPQSTQVNVNTAPFEVLAAMVANLDLTQARVLTQTRTAKPFRTLDDFRLALPGGAQARDEDLSVQSRFFVVEGQATVGKAEVRMQALLERRASGLPAVVWQRVL